MGILSKIGSGGLGGLVKTVAGVADEFHLSKEEERRFELEARKLEIEADKNRAAERLAQIEVNKASATHKSLFVAGARPFILWVGGIGAAYHFLFYPLCGSILSHYLGIEFVDLDWQELSVMLGGLLGFGGLRTYEKAKGVARERLDDRP